MGIQKKKLHSGDFLLLILTIGLVIFGVIMVFSSSYYASISEDETPYSYLIRDAGWAALGTVVMAFMSVFDYRHLKKLAKPLLALSIVLLLLLFTPLGASGNGATRWLDLGITIMPGEIAKICAIIFVAWFLSEQPKRIKSFKQGILPLFALCGVYAFLIIKQPNLSTAITICGIIILMMFVAGMSWGYCFGLVGTGVLGVIGLLVMDDGGYRVKRMVSFMDPFADALGDGYQVVQSLMALGSGGLFGVGLGKSIQKNLYLPEPQNDFILAIIGEELGYVGVLLLMAAYIVLIWRGIHIAINAPDQFGMLLASGITIMIALQVILNVAVVTSSMPPTGITLPLVSYGGNALMLFMASIGILLNISKHTTQVK